MANRKKKGFQTFDNFDDIIDAARANAGAGDSCTTEAEPEVEKISLADFVIKEKVEAFLNDYEPCAEFHPAAERFDDGRLREYFKAYVCGLGDPLGLYIEDLKMAGFRMVTSLATDKPAIFAHRKYV